MPLPPFTEENKILKTKNYSNENVINFHHSKLGNVEVRVVLEYNSGSTVIVPQYRMNDDSNWLNFEDDESKLGLQDIINENKRRDSLFTKDLRSKLEGEITNSELAVFFKDVFEKGYIEASDFIFNKFIAQTKDEFDVVALRKFYSLVNPTFLFSDPNATYENRQNQPVIDLSQRQELIKRVTDYVKTRNSQHRENIATSTVPIEAIKMSLKTSIGPRRYQAILGILRYDCGISLGEYFDEYVGNADKFKGIKFDHEDEHEDEYKEEDVTEFKQFNQEVIKSLDQDDGKPWEDLDKLLRSEAYKKDLNRIVEKLKPSDELKEEIKRHLLAIYSGGEIEDPFNRLKIILISERLKAKGLELDKAKDLATRFVTGEESIENLKQDISFEQMGDKKPSEEKLEAIFTKYAAFGKISDATQLRKRIVGKVLSQFQKKFAEQINHLDQIQTVEMDGSEILFRGIDQKSDLTEELIRQQFEDIHVGMSTSDGISQQLSSYKIQQVRVLGPGGLNSRASYATATTFNFAVAAKYVGDEGWIFDVRPKKGKLAINLQNISTTYQEIDFEAIDPEEIYAVYKVSRNFGELFNRIYRIEKVILNPHYKKRESDSLNLLVEGQEIEIEQPLRGSDSVKSSNIVVDGCDVFKQFNEEQLKIHGERYAEGSHLKEDSSTSMQNKEVEPSLWKENHNYNRSFSGIDARSEIINKDVVTNSSTTTSEEALWKDYKEGRNNEGQGAIHGNGWFWKYPQDYKRGNGFKVFITVEPEDLNKATEILIKNGYFNYDKLPKCLQKIPPYSEESIKRRLAIILYAEGEKTEESDKIWAERLNAIEKDFYEAGIKPRPLVSIENAAGGSKATDRKFPGSLYSYCKKDVFSWDWQKDNYFSGIKISVAESINQKIDEIKSEIKKVEESKDSSVLARLKDMLKAEELYLQISQVEPEKTEYIQSGANISDDEKTNEAKVISLASGFLKEENQKMTLERARYFWANELRRSTNIETRNDNILEYETDDDISEPQAAKEKVEGVLKSPKISSSSIPSSELEKELIEAKIFEVLNSSSTVPVQSLSAKEVAIQKATTVKGCENSAEEKLISAKLLDYAARGVLSKAIDAKNKLGSKAAVIDQTIWNSNGGSQKVWNNRCVRTDFTGVDLSGTYRTIFVNCTFDKECVLPTDKSSIDQKYFSNCSFSKELMDHPSNKNLKAALQDAGMKISEDGFFYEVGKSKREKYGEKKDKKIIPSTIFKPIESFKFIKEVSLVEM